jgi:FeS assembly SUF system regulator
MIRMSKLTDYALVIMAFIGRDPQHLMQTGDIALNTKIAKPTTAKLLKRLAKSGLLESQRGAAGGYKLAKAPEEISAIEIIESIEGKLAIMDCTLGQDHCAIYNSCTINAPWMQINNTIAKALGTIRLSDLHAVKEQHHD